MIRLAAGKLKPEHPQLSKKITEPGKVSLAKKVLAHRRSMWYNTSVRESALIVPQEVNQIAEYQIC